MKLFYNFSLSSFYHPCNVPRVRATFSKFRSTTSWKLSNAAINKTAAKRVSCSASLEDNTGRSSSVVIVSASKSWYKLQTVAGTGCRARQGPSSVAGPLNIRESCRKFAHTATGYRWNWSNWPRVHACFVLAVSRTRMTDASLRKSAPTPTIMNTTSNYPPGLQFLPEKKGFDRTRFAHVGWNIERFVIYPFLYKGNIIF